MVMADMNIKVPVNLKLQLRRHTGTLIFIYFNTPADIYNDSFFI